MSKTLNISIEVYDKTENDVIENAIQDALSNLGCDCMIDVEEVIQGISSQEDAFWVYSCASMDSTFCLSKYSTDSSALWIWDGASKENRAIFTKEKAEEKIKILNKTNKHGTIRYYMQKVK